MARDRGPISRPHAPEGRDDETHQSGYTPSHKRLSHGESMTPSPFVVQWVPKLALGTPPLSKSALDVAMGAGRHLPVLAAAGYLVFGVDRMFERVYQAKTEMAPLRAWCADLTSYPLPLARFDVVLVTRYLQRDLFASLQATVKPGGIVLYETFTRDQLRKGSGPTSPEHLLAPGELADRFAPFDVLFYEEVTEPEAVARLVARRP